MTIRKLRALIDATDRPTGPDATIGRRASSPGSGPNSPHTYR
jgi:hypothetical protein